MAEREEPRQEEKREADSLLASSGVQVGQGTAFFLHEKSRYFTLSYLKLSTSSLGLTSRSPGWLVRASAHARWRRGGAGTGRGAATDAQGQVGLVVAGGGGGGARGTDGDASTALQLLPGAGDESQTLADDMIASAHDSPTRCISCTPHFNDISPPSPQDDESAGYQLRGVLPLPGRLGRHRAQGGATPPHLVTCHLVT